MAKVKECISRQELMDMIEDYALHNDPSSLQGFVDSMYLRLRVEEVVEYVVQRSMIDGRTCLIIGVDDHVEINGVSAKTVITNKE